MGLDVKLVGKDGTKSWTEPPLPTRRHPVITVTRDGLCVIRDGKEVLQLPPGGRTHAILRDGPYGIESRREGRSLP
jgi:hypothetical protein